ncbi:hypothetical protein OG393_30785 [Streptomyces sp. NBC_01216]|uniref:hypothetical protein n=1 Tax=Streptomyces sp. NBC_01216 TaxID=2903778 RepID=UPI002E0E5361|nr:hypothetical protein OG393_30785 [Streptomyces sp. NBC_01216]
MNGPDHYRQAERLADQANHFTYGDGADPAVGAALAAEAQVHATLALAAATVVAASVDGLEPGMSIEEWKAWSRAVAVDPEGSEPR